MRGHAAHSNCVLDTEADKKAILFFFQDEKKSVEKNKAGVLLKMYEPGMWTV